MPKPPCREAKLWLRVPSSSLAERKQNYLATALNPLSSVTLCPFKERLENNKFYSFYSSSHNLCYFIDFKYTGYKAFFSTNNVF